jgi:glycosyltransferase involved in cell wall biosynthesis
MKKLAIISSYSESCGNSSFTKILCNSIEYFHKDVKTEVIELDLKLLQSIDGKIRKKADVHIANICKRLTEFDAVNIQMEAGLYGTLPNDITSRFAKLVKSNTATTVTLHSPRLIPANQSQARSGLKKILKLDLIGGIKDLIGDKYANIHLDINKKIIRACIESKAHLIVHTSRAKKQIVDLFSYENISVHPLKMIPANFNFNHQTFTEIKGQLDQTENSICIGMFGYISAYKGHKDALNALKLLPKKYKLLIFGRQHPQSLKSDGSTDPYLTHLVHMVTTDKLLKNRVFFLGELNDQDFVDVASCIDIAWLPYYENGQDGSGIASICLDVSPRVLCSTSFAFDELMKLVKYRNVMRFDIGNTQEMATKTEMFLKADIPHKPYGDESVFSLETQANTYVKF